VAKKKEVIEGFNKEEIIKRLTKEYGNVLLSGDLILNKPKHVIKVSPSFDYGFSRGIPEGCTVNLSGKPKSGKTTLALHIAAKCQLPENGSRQVIYGDIEERLKSMNLGGIEGLKPEEIIVVQSIKGNILFAERQLDILLKLAKDIDNFVMILDSVSALAPEKEFVDDTDASRRASGPKLLKDWLKKMKGVVSTNNGILILIHHMIANTSGKGKMFYEDGGNYVQHQSDIKAVCKTSIARADSDNRIVGKDMLWKIEWSAFGEEKEINSYLTYGIGIDEVLELINFGAEFAIIDKAGSWYTLPKSGERFQGQEKLYNFLLSKEGKEDLEFIREQVTEILG
jgi:recombination protein RecA